MRIRFQAMNRQSSDKQSQRWPRACLSPSRSCTSTEAFQGDASGTFGACSTSFCPGAVSTRGRLFATAAAAAGAAAIVAAPGAGAAVATPPASSAGRPPGGLISENLAALRLFGLGVTHCLLSVGASRGHGAGAGAAVEFELVQRLRRNQSVGCYVGRGRDTSVRNAGDESSERPSAR